MSNLVLVGVVWRQTRGDALDSVRREAVEQSDALSAVWRNGGVPAVAGAIAEARSPGDTSLLLAVFDGSGRKRVGTGPSALAAHLRRAGFRIGRLGQAREAGYEMRRIGTDWLLAGRTLDLLAAEERALERALAVAVLLSLALGVAAGLVVARYVGGRLDGIARVIDAAGEGDLSRRVGSQAGSGDAFDRLASRLDAMLAKVEALMGELRVVTDGLAHDLRSPLARLRTRAEQAALAEPGARDAALSGLLTETDLVMRMLTTAIEISRAEAVGRDRLQPAALAELVAEIAESLRACGGGGGARLFTWRSTPAPAPLPPPPRVAEPGGGEPARQCAQARRRGQGAITLQAERNRRAWAKSTIAVEDRGPGIAAAGPRAGTQALRSPRPPRARLPGAGLGHGAGRGGGAIARRPFRAGGQCDPGLTARVVTLPVR